MNENEHAIDEFMADREELARLCRIDGDAIALVTGVEDYDIMLSRCDTHEKILQWSIHLSEKSWITMRLLRAFMLTACNYHGLRTSV